MTILTTFLFHLEWWSINFIIGKRVFEVHCRELLYLEHLMRITSMELAVETPLFKITLAVETHTHTCVCVCVSHICIPSTDLVLVWASQIQYCWGSVCKKSLSGPFLKSLWLRVKQIHIYNSKYHIAKLNSVILNIQLGSR